MKLLLFLFTLSLSLNTFAQIKLDTIYANDQKHVALFFPKPIRQAVCGNKDFVFTYNREKQQYFGLLQAVKGKPSNLLVITTDGSVYSFMLGFKEQLKKYYHFITKNKSIGKEIPEIQKPKTELIKIASQPIPQEWITFSDFLLRMPPKNIRIKRKQGIRLRLQQHIYKGKQMYLVLELKNRSKIDFELEELRISVLNGTKRRKSSFQAITQQILYTHNPVKILTSGSTSKLVLVLPKYVLGANERLEVEFTEKNGGRREVL